MKKNNRAKKINVNQGIHKEVTRSTFFINPSSFYVLLIKKRHQITPSGLFWWRFNVCKARCSAKAPGYLFFVINFTDALSEFF